MELAVGTLTSSSTNSVESFLLDCPLDQTSPKNNQVNRIHNLDSTMSRIPLQVNLIFFQNPTYTAIFGMQIKEKSKYTLGQNSSRVLKRMRAFWTQETWITNKFLIRFMAGNFPAANQWKKQGFLKSSQRGCVQKTFKLKTLRLKGSKVQNSPPNQNFFAAMKQVQSLGFHLPIFIVFTQIHAQNASPKFGTSFGQNQLLKG